MVSAKYLITGASILLAASALPVAQDFPQNIEDYGPEDDQATPVEDPNRSLPTPAPALNDDFAEGVVPLDDDESAGDVAPLEKRCFLGLCKLFGGGSSGGSSSMSSNTSTGSSNTCTSSTCSTTCTQGAMTCAMLKVKRAILG
ncbi:hypothetical protein TRICI_000527 [Trichomonascus ciferrii]|uniref:Uncharacterized protein n=1 Tax=Trichomonascus ciferrii TaxID=44093 RepID=A0A642VD69_9ASCO|nr:hypothetical protein TRICI_000527 [Trichomonascus ciferrii]